MPLARDTSGKASTTGTSTTLSLTLGVNAKIIFAAVAMRGVDQVTGVTWDGVSMTELPTHSPKTFVYSLSTYTIHVYFLLAPATGTHNLVVTASSNPLSVDLDLYGWSMATVDGVNFPDNSTSNSSSGSPATLTLTPVGSGTWTFYFISNEDGAVAASTGSNLLQNQHGSGIFDSNGVVTGSVSMSVTLNNATWAGIMFSLANVVAGGAKPTRMMTGMGM